jgi:hypothetical protein
LEVGTKNNFDLDGYFWHYENIRWLLVIKGRFDETFDEHSRCTWVAGFIGDEGAWGKYVSGWRPALGVRKQLHMSSLRWKKPSTQTLLSNLAPIPKQSGLTGIVGGTRKEDLSDLVAGTMFEHHSTEYVMSVVDVTIQALLCVPDGERLEVIFEKRDQTEERARDALFAMQIMGYFGKSDPHLINSDGSAKLTKYGFEMKEGTILFDAADYLCYASLQKHRDDNSVRALWTNPILKTLSGRTGLMPREVVRAAFLNALAISS